MKKFSTRISLFRKRGFRKRGFWKRGFWKRGFESAPVGKYIFSAILILLFFSSPAASQQQNEDFQRFDISGLMRMRGWYTASESAVPGKFPDTGNFKSVNYGDIFFRTRINIRADEDIVIKSVFDIASSFGKKDFALGKGGTNIVTRDLYAVFSPDSSMQLSVGLMPFSLPGGYVLARDATGINFTGEFFNRRIEAYASYIKAFDDADDTYGRDTDPPDYAYDDVYYAGAKFSPARDVSSEFYYAFEYDSYTKDSDTREAALSWIGLHNRYSGRRMIFSLGGIWNFGRLNPDDGYKSVNSVLAELEAGYKTDTAEFAFAAEGASGDPGDPSSSHSFQDIKASRGFTLIAVDNSGGLSVRPSGESPWYGLAGFSFRAKKTFFESFIAEIKAAHFRTAGYSSSADINSRFGDEINIKAEYTRRKALMLTATVAVFFPGEAYKKIYSPGGTSPIYEFMLGTQINF